MFNFQKNKQKVFCLGFQGTGAERVRQALTILGYRASGWEKETYAAMIASMLEGDSSALLKRATERDGFAGLPWTMVYKELDKYFPNAQFILTLPGNEGRWRDKVYQETGDRLRGSYLQNPLDETLIYNYLFHKSAPEDFKTFYLGATNDIKRYFARRTGKLLEMRVDDGDGWNKLCAFIGAAPVPAVPFPLIDQREQRKDKPPAAGKRN